MPIWCHQLLTLAAALAGFGTGGSLFALVLYGLSALQPSQAFGWIALPVLLILFFALPLVCIAVAVRLVDKFPVRCPRCRGRVYKTRRLPLRYRCQNCGYGEDAWQDDGSM